MSTISSNIEVHPTKYISNFQLFSNDFALLKLAESLSYNYAVNYINVPYRDIESGFAFTTGWGTSEF